jgi:hypothetical protein
MFTKEVVMVGENDWFNKYLCIFESLLGPKMKSTFTSLLGTRAVEEIFKRKGWSMTKIHIVKLKKDPSLYEAMLQKGGIDKIRLSANARSTDEEKEAFLLQQFQRFEKYVQVLLVSGQVGFKGPSQLLG